MMCLQEVRELDIYYRHELTKAARVGEDDLALFLCRHAFKTVSVAHQLKCPGDAGAICEDC